MHLVDAKCKKLAEFGQLVAMGRADGLQLMGWGWFGGCAGSCLPGGVSPLPPPDAVRAG